MTGDLFYFFNCPKPWGEALVIPLCNKIVFILIKVIVFTTEGNTFIYKLIFQEVLFYTLNTCYKQQQYIFGT